MNQIATGVCLVLQVPPRGTRVVKIGPASGLLSFRMEGHGAHLVAIEQTLDAAWDFCAAH